MNIGGVYYQYILWKIKVKYTPPFRWCQICPVDALRTLLRAFFYCGNKKTLCYKSAFEKPFTSKNKA